MNARPRDWAGPLAAALLLALSAGMFWLAGTGLHTGETIWPSKSALQQRAVLRSVDPAQFWFAVGLYAGVGVGSLGLLIWGVRVARQPMRRAHRE
jgi:hypothetical protein